MGEEVYAYEVSNESREVEKMNLKFLFFFFKPKTAYEILRSDWRSDVCSSDHPLPLPLSLSHWSVVPLYIIIQWEWVNDPPTAAVFFFWGRLEERRVWKECTSLCRPLRFIDL